MNVGMCDECVIVTLCDDSGNGNDSKEPSECWADWKLYGPRKKQKERASSQIPPLMLCFQGASTNSLQNKHFLFSIKILE